MSTPSDPDTTRDTAFPANAHPRKAESVNDELLPDGSMVLFHAGRQELRTLNGTAALVWECCDGAHDVAAIVAEVREVFPDEPSIPEDVQTALRDLRASGMLAEEEEAASP